MSEVKIEKVNKIGRNEPCPCGSGKKYKRCCLHQEVEREHNESCLKYFKKGERDRLLQKYMKNYGGQTIGSIPQNYSKPEEFRDDLGLELWKLGIREHVIEFLPPSIGWEVLPTSEENTFLRTSQMSFIVRPVPEGIGVYGSVEINLNFQLPWMSNERFLNSTTEMIYEIYFPSKIDFKHFLESMKGGDKVLYRFLVSDPVETFIQGHHEVYSILIYGGSLKGSNEYKLVG